VMVFNGSKTRCRQNTERSSFNEPCFCGNKRFFK
jgi:hypothetical protein